MTVGRLLRLGGGGVAEALTDLCGEPDEERAAEGDAPHREPGGAFRPMAATARVAWTNSEACSSSTLSTSAGNPMRVAKPSPLDQIAWHGLAHAMWASSWALASG